MSTECRRMALSLTRQDRAKRAYRQRIFASLFLLTTLTSTSTGVISKTVTQELSVPNGQETTLRTDPVTGFLVSPRSDRISVEQKQLVISIYGETGNMLEAAKAAGLDCRVIRQLRGVDEKFDTEIQECERGFVERAKGYMLTHMARPGNYMDRVTIARRFEPGVWGDQVNHNVQHNVTVVKQITARTEDYKDQP